MAEVGCAGILVADTFCGPMAALPEAGQLRVIGPMVSRAGGCAANVAIGLARQGVSVDVAGCLGRDAGAGVVTGALADHGVGTEPLTWVAERPTSQTVILLVDGEDRRYLHNFGANEAFTVSHIDRDWARALAVFYLGGLFVMPSLQVAELAELLADCRRHGVRTVVDVVVPDEFPGTDALSTLLPHVDWLLPNDDEARRLTGEVEPERQVRALLDAGADTVVVTLGDDGALAGRGGELWRCDAYPMSVVDPSGAGDAFATGIVLGALREWDLPRTLRYAGALGASATRAVGTTDGLFSPAEAEAFIAAQPLAVERIA